jgi:5S rRNA maturation endonuclease (ribonuclease M5)
MFNAIKQSIQNTVNPTLEKPTPIMNIPGERDRLKGEVNKLFAKSLNEGYEVKGVYTYRTLDGTPIYRRVRLEHADGRKIIRPIKNDGDNYTFGEPSFSGKKPLYLQERLKLNDEPVFVVEGENKAARLSSLGIVSVTSGGATSAASTDWSPLQGRTVIIWPDNDQPGKDFAKNSADILLELGCHVVFVDIDKLDLNESDDVIDWLARNPGASESDIRALPLIGYKDISSESQKQDPNAVVSNEWKEPLSVTAIHKGKPYPVEALPESILRSVQEVVDFTQCPLPMAACSAIANISLVAQCLVNVQRTAGLNGPVSLYYLMIADSGERKTSVDNKFSVPIKQWENQKADAHKEEKQNHLAEHKVWEIKEQAFVASIKSGIKKGADTSDKEMQLMHHMQNVPKQPILQSLIYTDATTEALADDLAHNLRYGGIFSSEAGSVLGGAGMQKDAAMKYFSLLNILWDGNPHNVLRKSSESFTVKDARLSICLAIQDAPLREFLASSGKLARGTGFLARFLITNPESTQGTRMFKEAPENWPALDLFYIRIKELLDLIDMDKPFSMLHLSKAAKNLWVEFHDRIELQLAPGGDFTEIRDVASKAADNVARLAAIFHVYEHGIEGEINENHMERATRIIEWHLHSARDYLAAAKEKEQINEFDMLKNWLINECIKNEANAIKYSTALQSGPNPLRKKDILAKVLDGLVNANIVRITVSEGTKFIDLNPALLFQEATNDTHY